MKKIIYIAFISVLLAGTSCSDLLKEESFADVDKDTFMNNAKEANIVLLGVYRNLVNDGLYAYNLSVCFDLTNDLAQCEGMTTNGFREVPTNTFNKSNSQVQTTWQQLYAAIYTANDFLEGINAKKDGYSAADQQLAETYIAEAKALRALFYFELVRWFGNIPLILTNEDSDKDASEFTQASQASTYAQIERDLKAAAEVLPWATDNSRPFRMSKGAVLGLLTKVYATWAGHPVRDESKWATAAETAEMLVSSGKHNLNPDFEQIWRNTANGKWEPNESLIEVSSYAPAVTGSASPVGRIGKWNGVVAPASYEQGRNSGNVKVVFSFTQKWQALQDPRFRISIADYKFADNKTTGKVEAVKYARNPAQPTLREMQLYTPRKWTTEYVEKSNMLVDNDKSNINWYVLRYADVLLLYAEALNEAHNGPTTEAYNAVNSVRRRGYGLPIETAAPGVDLTGLDQEAFRAAIRDERAYELSFEGHRRLDLVRWGIYYETLQSTNTLLNAAWPDVDAPNYIAARHTVKGKHELFPVPQREMDLMPQFKQNPQW